MEIRHEELTSPAALTLIGALNRDLTERYPDPGTRHFRLAANEVAEGRGAFLVAYLDGRPVGCGAIRRLDEERAEVKRMYVEPSARGQGIGQAILGELEAEARRLGVGRLVLETGDRQAEALRLYARAGFTSIPAFGEYVGSPVSVCLAKDV
jgi:GNAT superfamily N-acetyltransferase